uniref:Uncharacterized protein n=1 Tax=Tanacetum cinerariifolium TaxID=118510 RepID=A0A6L2JGA2_TANCI|nr:hypothetical protein [Tanacetum cinerariifolium]
MKAIQDAITAGTIPPKTDREILAEITRSTNRAHIAVFPGSISTPGGPSSTSPSPSSTPLGLGNCYTLTFDPETSQSDEQEDNGSDDGNHEYDVDIYDDE